MDLNSQSIIVGIDVHKYTHTAVALNSFGQDIDQYVFNNTTISQFLTWLTALGVKNQILVGIEDIHGAGTHVARAIVQSGIMTRYVPPVLTDRERKRSTRQAKSDLIDAKRVAQVIITKGEKTLPADPIIHKDQTAVHCLDLIIQERSSLVKQQTGLKNQLHSLLHQYYGDDYKHGFKQCFSKKALSWYLTNLKIAKPDDVWKQSLVTAIIRRIQHLQVVQKQIKQLDQELNQLSSQLRLLQVLQTSLPGCGADSAAKIMAEIKTIHRFASKTKLASYAGVAPVPRSSGSKIRWRTNKGGNRKLNKAFHQIALSQIGNWGPEFAKQYYGKKQGEGKSKLWSIRCLKRRISNKVYTILKSAS